LNYLNLVKSLANAEELAHITRHIWFQYHDAALHFLRTPRHM